MTIIIELTVVSLSSNKDTIQYNACVNKLNFRCDAMENSAYLPEMDHRNRGLVNIWRRIVGGTVVILTTCVVVKFTTANVVIKQDVAHFSHQLTFLLDNK